MKNCFTLCLLFLIVSVRAQELVFDVQVNAPTLQLADPKIFRELESKLIDFLNNRKWTNEDYEEYERIKCNLILTIRSELSATAFDADLTLQASRPVFGSTYETPLLNHVDKELTFGFEETTPVIYSENIFNDNLTSTLAFYVYFILGLDNDSYMLYGGDEYFQKASEIVNTVPSDLQKQSQSGWSNKANGRNRYFMIENTLSPRSRPYRKAIYDYHRLGLDLMHKDPQLGKGSIVDALKEVEQVSNDYVNSMIVQMFANAKAQELNDIFALADRNQKNEVYRIMTGIDPANRNKYIPIRR